jgi:E1A-binding protein p400
MVEGTKAHNDDVINRLHGIIRPFVLRRLKKDVESQMPGKFEHIIKCQLSRRQMFIYEEYMARSSTRQSLKKGGNIMDMMNVLMQLRKVCNHPDLFEPRPVITPFVMEDIGLSLPTAAFSIMDSSPLTEVSRRLIVPIWSGSSGLPGTDFALRHDKIEHNELMTLCEATLPAPMQVQTEMSDPKDDSVVSRNLAALWAEIESQQCEERAEQRKFLSKLNASRCHQAPFAYPLRLLDQMTLSTANSDNRFSECLSSPASLLKMKKTQQERAQDVDELVKKFVFCVPKAGSRGPSLECGASLQSVSKRKSIEDMLLEPLEETLRPFQAAEARLSSFFPDKKLVQFDAGKLQVLAELLRELKSGGHRVLIFTQMSKMLDILEVCP